MKEAVNHHHLLRTLHKSHANSFHKYVLHYCNWHTTDNRRNALSKWRLHHIVNMAALTGHLWNHRSYSSRNQVVYSFCCGRNSNPFLPNSKAFIALLLCEFWNVFTRLGTFVCVQCCKILMWPWIMKFCIGEKNSWNQGRCVGQICRNACEK